MTNSRPQIRYECGKCGSDALGLFSEDISSDPKVYAPFYRVECLHCGAVMLIMSTISETTRHVTGHVNESNTSRWTAPDTFWRVVHRLLHWWGPLNNDPSHEWSSKHPIHSP